MSNFWYIEYWFITSSCRVSLSRFASSSVVRRFKQFYDADILTSLKWSDYKYIVPCIVINVRAHVGTSKYSVTRVVEVRNNQYHFDLLLNMGEGVEVHYLHVVMVFCFKEYFILFRVLVSGVHHSLWN